MQASFEPALFECSGRQAVATAMFLRTVKARGHRGEKHEYLRLVESYREDGVNKQRVVMNVGHKDQCCNEVYWGVCLFRHSLCYDFGGK